VMASDFRCGSKNGAAGTPIGPSRGKAEQVMLPQPWFFSFLCANSMSEINSCSL
jgi:hypothetical protein